MKATEIVSKLKDVLLSSSEEVEAKDSAQEQVQEEVQEEVQLEANTEEVKEEVQLEEAPEVDATEEVEAQEAEMSYASSCGTATSSVPNVARLPEACPVSEIAAGLDVSTLVSLPMFLRTVPALRPAKCNRTAFTVWCIKSPFARHAAITF